MLETHYITPLVHKEKREQVLCATLVGFNIFLQIYSMAPPSTASIEVCFSQELCPVCC